jgi:hypothetical protein
VPKNLAFLGQTLRRHLLASKDALLLLREMNDDLSNRLRKTGISCKKSPLGWLMAKHGSLGKQMALPLATDDTDTSIRGPAGLLYEAGVEDFPSRVFRSPLGSSPEPLRALSLFEKPEDAQERHRLDASLDAIRARYGKNSVLRCSSLLEGPTAKPATNKSEATSNERSRHDEMGAL